MFRRKPMTPSSVMIKAVGCSLQIHQSAMCHTAEDRNFDQLNPFKVSTEKENEILLL
jgi:hypothetical protein